MSSDQPVVKVIQDKCRREENDRDAVQLTRVLEDPLDSVTTLWVLVIYLIFILVQPQCVDRQDDSVLRDCTEYHEYTRHHELVNCVKLAGP